MTVDEGLAMFRRSKPNRVIFKRLICAYDAFVFILGVSSIRFGISPLAASVELLASQLPLFFVGWLREDSGEWTRKDGTSQLARYNPRQQSWAFLADFYAIGPMFFVAARAQSKLPHNVFFTGALWPFWALASLALGLGLSWVFRRGEGKGYDVLRYTSYTKLLHNGVAFTVLSSLIIYSLIPLFFTGVWSGGARYPVWYAVFFALYLLSAIGDSVRAGLPEGHAWRLDGCNLHAQTDESGRRLPVEIAGMPTYHQFRHNSPQDSISWVDVLQPGRWLLLGRHLLEAVGVIWRKPAPVVSPTRAEGQPGPDNAAGDSQEQHGDGPTEPG
jgi:hypothetical protein